MPSCLVAPKLLVCAKWTLLRVSFQGNMKKNVKKMGEFSIETVISFPWRELAGFHENAMILVRNSPYFSDFFHVSFKKNKRKNVHIGAYETYSMFFSFCTYKLFGGYQTWTHVSPFLVGVRHRILFGNFFSKWGCWSFCGNLKTVSGSLDVDVFLFHVLLSLAVW